MLDLKALKLQLLADSKNMLILAEKGQWDRLKELDLRWQELMKSEFSSYRQDLADIIPQLLSDNEQLQAYILAGQQELLDNRQKNHTSFNKVKSYLN